jgi:hypothetical protein
VYSHTTPLKYEPREFFLNFIEQDSVGKSTEIWLYGIEERLEYKISGLGTIIAKKELIV